MNNIQRIIMEELVNDDLNFGLMDAVLGDLLQPVDIVEPERVNPVRNEDYYENVIPNYTLDDFHSHFRMNRATFESLKNRLQENREIGVEHVPFEKKLLFTIWVLSKPESFLSAGDRFNIAKSTSHGIFFQVVSLIVHLTPNFIVWPNEQERQRISRTLHLKSDIPGIIGAIDGCHIPIKAPPHNPVDYYNRNNYHSVVLQAVCNDKKLFIDVFVGMPGRIHDARVFRNSDIHALLTGDNPPIHANEHLLGDAAYPLLPCLLKPYRDNGHLNERQTRFNTRMSSVRTMIEQAFGLLKGKFRRLKYLDMARIDFVPSVVTAACLLHNFIIMNEGIEIYEDNEGDFGMPEGHQDDVNDDERNAGDAAQYKRDFISSLLN